MTMADEIQSRYKKNICGSSKVEIRYLPDDMGRAFILSDGGHYSLLFVSHA